MKRFNFKAQLKGMNLDSLKELKSYHLDYMLGFIGLNDKEAGKHSRYVGYIDDAISKIKSN